MKGETSCSERNWRLHANFRKRSKMKTHQEMIDKWMKYPEFVAEYDALADEFSGHAVRGLPLQLQQRTRTKLLAIDDANRLNDLLTPPGNRLEALRADRRGQYSLRINNRWRICFV